MVIGTSLCPLLLSILTSQQELVGVVLFWVLIIGLVFISCLCSYHLHKNIKKITEENLDLKNKISNTTSDLEDAREDINKLKGDLRTLHQEYVEKILVNCSQELDLQSTDRVSIYFEKDGIFNILGRYSTNPKFKKIRTQKFKKNNGVIGKIWEDGVYKDASCPNFIKKANSENKKYYGYQKKNYGYCKGRLDSLTMKSSGYIGKAIIKNNNNIGVILYESENNKRFLQSEKIINDMMNTHNNDFLILVESGIAHYNVIIPSGNTGDTEAEVLSELGGNNE